MKHQLPVTASILFFLLFSLPACKPSPEQAYDQNGMRLMIPEGWKIVDEQVFGNGEGFNLACAKGGLTNSGLISVSWFPQLLDLTAVMDGYKQELKMNPIFKMATVEFADGKEAAISGNAEIATDYKVNLLGEQIYGSIVAYHCKEITIVYLRQGAESEREENEPGFQRLISSLPCF